MEESLTRLSNSLQTSLRFKDHAVDETQSDRVWSTLSSLSHPRVKLNALNIQDTMNALISAEALLRSQDYNAVDRKRHLNLFCMAVTHFGGQRSFQSVHDAALCTKLAVGLLQLLESVENTRQQHLDILRALNALLHNTLSMDVLPRSKFPSTVQLLSAVVTPSRSHMTPFCGSMDLRTELDRKRMALNCLISLLQRKPSKEDLICVRGLLQATLELMEVLLQRTQSWLQAGAVLESDPSRLVSLMQSLAMTTDGSQDNLNEESLPPLHIIRPAVVKLLVAGLRTVQAALMEHKTLLSQDNVGQVLKLVHSFAFTTAQTAPTNDLYRFGYNAYTAASQVKASPKKYIPPHLRMSLISESEVSDFEGAKSTGRSSDKDDFKLKQQALSLLQTVASISSKLIYPYWSVFMDDKAVAELRNISADTLVSQLNVCRQVGLFHLMTVEPDYRIRLLAWNAFAAMMQGSKPYLAVAMETSPSKKSASFVSLSEKTFELVLAFHRFVVAALYLEREAQVIQEIVQAVDVLIQNVTYERIQSLLLVDVVLAFVNCVKLQDAIDFRMACFKSIVNAVEVVLENEKLRTKYLSELGTVFFGNDGNDGIVNFCLSLCQKPSTSALLRTQAMDILRVAVQMDFAEMKARFELVDPILASSYQQDMTNREEDNAESALLAISSLKLLIAYMDSSTAPNEGFPVEWWNTVVDWYLQKSATLNSTTMQSVRAIACEAFSCIPEFVMLDLPERCQTLCITLLLGMAQDSAPVVRASACRTLGVYLMLPSLRKDALFMKDVMEVSLQLLHDSNLSVKMKATWTLANVTDALILESLPAGFEDKSDARLPDDFPVAIVMDMLRRILPFGKDNEKFRSNLIRAVGNIIRLLCAQVLEHERNSLVQDSMNFIAYNIEHGIAKTRWNACHALGIAVRNPRLPFGTSTSADSPLYTSTVLKALQHALTRCKNFKVRGHACHTLSLLSRPHFTSASGVSMVLDCFKCLIATWQQLQGAEDARDVEFSEIKHIEQLKTELKSTCRHLLGLFNDWEFKKTLQEWTGMGEVLKDMFGVDVQMDESVLEYLKRIQ